MDNSENWQKRFENAKRDLLNDPSIHAANRELFGQFYEFMERKLKRMNGHAELDKSSYKTLYTYIKRLRNVDRWFGKPLKDITREDVQRVYDDLEEGRIKTSDGKAFKSKKDYYSKVFKSKLFALVGKDGLAREVIEFPTKERKEVRYLLEPDFRRLQEGVNQPHHKALLWLAFDIGENINSLLLLRKCDLVRQKNKDTGEPEYIINLREETLKRARLSRSEPTNYSDTVRWLDVILVDIEDDKVRIFDFGYNTAFKILRRATERTKVKCQPKNDELSWKDLRSGMASDLLHKGWTVEEINGRLGHRPSSREIDVYVSHFALNKSAPKRKVTVFKQDQLEEELQQLKQQNKSLARQQEHSQEEIAALRNLLADAPEIVRMVKAFKKLGYTRERFIELVNEKVEKRR